MNMKTFDDFEIYHPTFETPEDKKYPKIGEVIRCKIKGKKIRAKVRRIKLVSPKDLREAVESGETIDPFLVMAAHPIRGLAVWLAEVSPAKVQSAKAKPPEAKAREGDGMGRKKDTFRQQMRLLGHGRAKCAEHVCNGDPHPSLAWSTSDKNANAKAWEVERDKYEEQIEELAKTEGMTVEYNGLYPTFKTKDGVTIYWG